MKKIYFHIQLILLLFSYQVFSQNIYTKYESIWEFVPIKGSNDTTFKSFSLFKNNKSIEITFWKETKKSSIYGSPFTYFGFWDSSYYGGLTKPKHISELKSTGRFIFFYDDLLQDLNQENKIGYDSLGNLYRPTRSCDWGFINNGTGIEFNFGSQPDEYKKVNKIPDYVLLSLKKNKEDWIKYLDFIEHKELKIEASKSTIHILPRKPTKMYLLNGDEVEIIEEKDEWLRIRYYGKKVIEGWIKKSDVE
jgi:hypothetical protein